jgi:hypothetical protein
MRIKAIVIIIIGIFAFIDTDHIIAISMNYGGDGREKKLAGTVFTCLV